MNTPLEKTLSIISLDKYGLIAVKGNNALSFLQGQLSSDINQISLDNHGLSAYCNQKGRIRSIFRIFKETETSYFLRLPKEILEVNLNILNKYGQFSMINIQDQTANFSIIGLMGENALALLQKVFINLDVSKKLIRIKNLLILNIPGKITRYEIYGSPSDIDNLKTQLSQLAVISLQDFQIWQKIDLESKIPEIETNTFEKLLPHYINLIDLKAVSFNKGCFSGQEIIARMHYRTTIKKHLQIGYVEMPEPLNAGFSLYNQTHNKQIGQIINSCYIKAYNHYSFLCEIEDEFIFSKDSYIETPNKTIYKFQLLL
ncbi:MAG: folate-binding protein YgfZ [Francisellaceae bacterium]|nr:folate-binding protein YgfZ [Francisellaceae bacterium]